MPYDKLFTSIYIDNSDYNCLDINKKRFIIKRFDALLNSYKQQICNLYTKVDDDSKRLKLDRTFKLVEQFINFAVNKKFVDFPNINELLTLSIVHSNIEEKYYPNPQMYAHHDQQGASLIDLILPYINPNMLYGYRMNIAWMPLLTNSPAILKTLIKHGTSMVHVSQYLQTPLSIAANAGSFAKRYTQQFQLIDDAASYNLLTIILTSGQITSENIDTISTGAVAALELGVANNCYAGRETALSSAIFHNKMQNAELLITYGANLNTKVTASGDTLLHEAIRSFNLITSIPEANLYYANNVCNCERMQMFYNYIHRMIELGADLTVENNDGITPKELLEGRASAILFNKFNNNNFSQNNNDPQEIANTLQECYRRTLRQNAGDALRKRGFSTITSFLNYRQLEGTSEETTTKRKRRRLSLNE